MYWLRVWTLAVCGGKLYGGVVEGKWSLELDSPDGRRIGLLQQNADHTACPARWHSSQTLNGSATLEV